MKKAQSSMEYVILAGILLVVLTPLFYYAFNKSSENIKLSQAEDLVESLAKAADDVYALSPGTKKYVWVSTPGSVEEAQVDASEISVTISIFSGSSDITAVTKATITGEIPINKGTYRIPVEHLDSGVVLIGIGNDTTPPTITWTSPEGLTCNPVTLRTNTDEPTSCRFDTSDDSYENMNFQMTGSAIGHSHDLGVQSEGSYNYFVRCSDAFNNAMATSAVINYSINFSYCGEGQIANETDPPIVTLINPASEYVSNSSMIDFLYNVTDDSLIFLCRLIVDSSILETVYTPERDATNTITGDLDLGTYDWSINCTDSFGNEGNSTERSIEVNATLDTDFPNITITRPANGSIRNFNLVKFFYNVTDATSDIYSCTLSVFGNLDSGGTSSQAITDFSVNEEELESLSLNLGKGNHTWNISCKDNSIYRNEGGSDTWWLRINMSTEESFITSCAGECGSEGYSNGVCRQNPSKCTSENEDYIPEGDQYCTGGPQSDTCCCVP